MALFNYATKEITIKIVYYGPGLSGKTTNLQYLHSVLDPRTKGKLLSIATEADRTLFFDFLPVELGKIKNFSIRFQLYTVPGQVRYNATRKLVLRGADAIVFVADSQRDMREQNIESLQNMYDNLIANGINPNDIPVVLQYNKRDLHNILSIEELNKDLNEGNKYEYTESIAIEGLGVENTFQHITKHVLKRISDRHNVKVQPSEDLQETILKNSVPANISVDTIVDKTSSLDNSLLYGTKEDTNQEELTQLSFENEIIGIKEEILKDIKEILSKQEKKMEDIIKNINDISNTLSDIKDSIEKLKSENNGIKREQKDIFSILRDIRHSFENIKEKKSWFRFI